MTAICRLYLITPPRLDDLAGFGRTLAETLDAGDVAALQIRLKDQPDDLVINTHVCRGNFHSTWLSSGGYAPVAAKLFGEENVDAYYLEFDDDRSGDFAPLAEVSGDKKVVLGLITR